MKRESEKNGRRKEKKTWRQQWKEKLDGKFSEIFSFSKKFPNVVVVVSLAVVKLRLKFVVVVIWTKLTQNEHHNNNIIDNDDDDDYRSLTEKEYFEKQKQKKNSDRTM